MAILLEEIKKALDDLEEIIVPLVDAEEADLAPLLGTHFQGIRELVWEQALLLDRVLRKNARESKSSYADVVKRSSAHNNTLFVYDDAENSTSARTLQTLTSLPSCKRPGGRKNKLQRRR